MVISKRGWNKKKYGYVKTTNLMRGVVTVLCFSTV